MTLVAADKGGCMDYQPDIPVAETASEDFFKIVRRQYNELQVERKENEAVQLLYHSPAGEQIHILYVYRDRDSDTLVFRGVDKNGNVCHVVTQAQSVQLLMKIVSPTEPERRTVGFAVKDPEEAATEAREQTEQAAPSIDRQELMDLLANASTPTEVQVARAAANTWLGNNPSDGDVRVARDHLPNPTGD